MPTGEYTFRSEPPHSSQVVSESSVNFWTTSSRSSHAVHAYWYVGTGPSLHVAGTHRHRLPNVNADRPLTNPSGPLCERQPRDPGGGAGDQPHPPVVAGGPGPLPQPPPLDERGGGGPRRDPGHGAGITAPTPAEPDAAPVGRPGQAQHP